MSDTHNHKKAKHPKLTANKSKPYLATKDAGSPKIRADHSDALGVTPLGKLVAKNANRGRKKAARQEADQEIKKALTEKAEIDEEENTFYGE